MSATENEVITLCISPVNKSSINYYFFVVELPLTDTIVFSEGTWDSVNNVLTYTFSYGKNTPDENTPLKAYMLPVFLTQYENYDPEYPIDLNNCTVNLIEKGSDTPKRQGMVINPKKTSLFDRDLQGASPMEEETLPLDEVRSLVVKYTASDDEDYYWIIAMSLTESGGRTNNLLMIPQPGTSAIQCWYTSRSSMVENPASDYVAACNFLPSSEYGEYENISIEQNASVEVDYENAYDLNEESSANL